VQTINPRPALGPSLVRQRVSPKSHKPSQFSSQRSSFVFIGAAIALLLTCQLAFCFLSRTRSLQGNVDLRAFYAAGRILASGHGSSLYRFVYEQQVQTGIFHAGGQTLPFIYPAYTALFFVPLSLVPYKVAFLLFWLFNAGLLALTGALLRAHLVALRQMPVLIIIVGFACLFPVSIAWMQGQVSFLLLLSYSMAYVLLEQKRPFLAGLVVALALTKFQIALPVALLFLCWRVYRFVGGFLCGALLLGIISVAITGTGGMFEYIVGLGQMGRTTLLHATDAKQHYGMFAGDMPNLHGFFFAITRGSLAGQACAATCSLGAILWAWSQRASLPLALVTAMLVSYHMQPYDLVLLLLPLTIALSHLLQTERRTGNLWWKQAVVLALSIGILIAPIAPWLLVEGRCSLFLLPVLGCLWNMTQIGRDSTGDSTLVNPGNRSGSWARPDKPAATLLAR
jgi:hypothetical protein